MAAKRGLRTRRRYQKQKKQTRRYRRDPTSKRGSLSIVAPSNIQNNLTYSSSSSTENYSPVSTPGKNNSSPPNSPITMKAKMLASMYPNRETMIKRSMSFSSSNKVNNNAWWKQMEEEWGTVNQEYFPG